MGSDDDDSDDSEAIYICGDGDLFTELLIYKYISRSKKLSFGAWPLWEINEGSVSGVHPLISLAFSGLN